FMTEVLGKPVRYQQISFDDFKAGFVQRGMSNAMANAMIDMYKAKNEGLDNGVQRTPENTTPTTFRQWCEEVLTPAIVQ
ncbi:NmrA family transcriptional regulator, partial [Pseudomonas sihuiensis]